MRKLWFGAASGFFMLLVALGSIPGAANALSQRYGDKLLHTLAYGFIAALYFHAYRGSKLTRSCNTVFTIALLGALDETGQSFLPYRNASLADWCFDMASALLIVALLAWRTSSLPGPLKTATHID